MAKRSLFSTSQAGGNSSYTDNAVTVASTYLYRVTATNSQGNITGASLSVTIPQAPVTVTPSQPSPPTNPNSVVPTGVTPSVTPSVATSVASPPTSGGSYRACLWTGDVWSAGLIVVLLGLLF